MAGYMFTLKSLESLHRCVESGTYSTFMSEPRGRWGIPAEGTYADFATMQPGDNVYFFIDRRIYGIGEMVEVGGSCRFQNYPGASSPAAFDRELVDGKMLVDDDIDVPASKQSRSQRWACIFRPAPFFFTEGVDMDDVLSSEPAAFRILRAIWKLSFIKFDDEENQAFRNAVLKLNQAELAAESSTRKVFVQRHAETHERAGRLISQDDYRLDSAPIVQACTVDGRLTHEMAVEAGLLSQLSGKDGATIKALGHWDYLSHQVVSSPFKPIDYMDKMDVFGYSWVPGYRPTISRYLVAEIKKDTASLADVEQTLKYVDWVKDEYAHGDYSMIRAFLIAAEIAPSVAEKAAQLGQRSFTIQRRPARSTVWSSLRLLQYRVDDSGHIALRDVTHGGEGVVSI